MVILPCGTATPRNARTFHTARCYDWFWLTIFGAGYLGFLSALLFIYDQCCLQQKSQQLSPRMVPPAQKAAWLQLLCCRSDRFCNRVDLIYCLAPVAAMPDLTFGKSQADCKFFNFLVCNKKSEGTYEKADRFLSAGFVRVTVAFVRVHLSRKLPLLHQLPPSAHQRHNQNCLSQNQSMISFRCRSGESTCGYGGWFAVKDATMVITI
jgi:hypothetical protein